jgi:hypothetical protein
MSRCPPSALTQGHVIPLDAQEFLSLRRRYWQANRLWSASCFVGSVGPISMLRQYIEQENPACLTRMQVRAAFHHRPKGRRTSATLVAPQESCATRDTLW